MMRLTIIGFGNQAKSWLQNLKDSGFPVRVALRPHSHSFDLALKAGFEVVEIGSPEFYEDKAFAFLTPDLTHHEILSLHAAHFQKGSSILYAHGFSVLKHQLHKKYPHLKHILFAPKSIGSELRRQYELGGKLGAVYSLEFFWGEVEQTEQWLMKLAVALGINMGPFKTSFIKETEADLYSEQGLLCSVVPYTAAEMFHHLVEAGTEPELAYFECWHELKLIVNTMVDKGPQEFFKLISPNALIGAEKGFQKLFTPEFHRNLKSLLTEIQDGTFNKELDQANVEEIRQTISDRWKNSSLMKTFEQMNKAEK